jgi:hypothetical protein
MVARARMRHVVYKSKAAVSNLQLLLWRQCCLLCDSLNLT